MTLSYRKLHWGRNPLFVDHQKTFANERVVVVGEIAAISYATAKGTEHTVYRHAFKRHPMPDGKTRGPYLFVGDPKGDHRIGNAPAAIHGLGQVIDVELAGGERVLLSAVWVATNDVGSQLWLSSPYPLDIQVEKGKYFVTEHGIEE